MKPELFVVRDKGATYKIKDSVINQVIPKLIDNSRVSAIMVELSPKIK